MREEIESQETHQEIHLPAMSPFLPHGHQRLFMGWPWETEGKVHEAGRSPTVGSPGGFSGFLRIVPLTPTSGLVFVPSPWALSFRHAGHHDLSLWDERCRQSRKKRAQREQDNPELVDAIFFSMSRKDSKVLDFGVTARQSLRSPIFPTWR